MSKLYLLSGHGYDWSDKTIWKISLRIAQASAVAAGKASAVGRGAARLIDRALQALRKAGLQMCRRPRPRTEVLSVGELSGRTTADGLRATRGYRSHAGAHRQLPRGAHGARGGLRDQPRAVTAPRGALRCGGERNIAAAHHPDRRFRCRETPRQHGRGMAAGRAARNHHRGDHR
jgi:hypothetical protein